MRRSASTVLKLRTNAIALVLIGSILWLGSSRHCFLELPVKILRVVWPILRQAANSFRKNMAHSDVLVQQGSQLEVRKLVDRLLSRSVALEHEPSRRLGLWP